MQEEAPIELKKPARQLSQVPAPDDSAFFPAAHKMHEVATAPENEPGEQVTQELDPTVAEYFPAVQSMHTLLMPSE
jgi:hypothetical protein